MTSGKISLSGRVAVVTGAAGGLGRTHALLLAARGAKVVVNDLGAGPDGVGSSGRVEDVAKEIRDAGGEALANYSSVSSPDGGEELIAATVKKFGTVDIVVNNAGFLRDKTFAKLTREDLDAIIDVHLKGAFHVSQPAYRVMRERNFGRFIFTTSTAGLFGNFGQSNYASAKSGLLGLSSVIAIEGARNNITSNVLAPMARTRLTESLLGPLAEFVEPEQVSPLVAYLVSEECTLSHEVFVAGGGRFARVFLGVGPGWFAGKGARATPEDMREHIQEIRSTADFSIPMNAGEESALLVRQLQR